VPFIRQTRDRRGYDSTCVLHVYRPAHGAPQTRVLYLFRSPAHLRVGRSALDDEAREGLEHTHPDLSFDWNALTKDSERVDRWERPRSPKPDGPRGRRGDRGETQPDTRPSRPARREEPRPSASPVSSDDSVLATVAGVEQARALRQRYLELRQRIGRRVTGEDDRARLLERLERLNPDGWPDESAVRTGLVSLKTEWDQLSASIPGRRRGRRGGRGRRDDAESARPATSAGSGIIGEGGDTDDEQRTGEAMQPDRRGDALRDNGRVGAGAAETPATETADPGDPGPASDL
jgi:hypothetical protein